MLTIFFIVINSFSKMFYQKKTLMLETDSVASIGGQRKYTKYVSYPWPPMVAALNFNVYFLICTYQGHLMASSKKKSLDFF